VLGLDLQKGEHIPLARELVNVGLAEQLPFEYLRFDPALASPLLGEMSTEESDSARAAWAEPTVAEIDFLYRQQSTDANLAQNLCLLDLPNLLAVLEFLAKTEGPGRIVDLATSLEALVALLNRPNVLARVVSVRTAAALGLGDWSHAQYLAEDAAVDRLIEQGLYADAIRRARSLLDKAEQAGVSAFPEAAYDYAMARWKLGRCLKEGGAAAEAVPLLDEARGGFEKLVEAGMANAALIDKADCLMDLGRYDEAAAAYEETIETEEQLGDLRSVAACKNQLATVRLWQRRHGDALKLYFEALTVFKELGEASSVAKVWPGWNSSPTDRPARCR
jgi:tetratricopeptide (TPR) repeat protein